MFSIEAFSETYKYPVKLATLNEAGEVVTTTFTAVFQRLTDDQIQALIDERVSDKEIAARYLKGWEDVDAPFNDANLARLLNITGMKRAVAKAMFESFAVEDPADVKN